MCFLRDIFFVDGASAVHGLTGFFIDVQILRHTS